jgi:hypothetical protein
MARVAPSPRVLDFLGGEVAHLEKGIARQAIDSPEIRRLVTIPGVVRAGPTVTRLSHGSPS